MDKTALTLYTETQKRIKTNINVLKKILVVSFSVFNFKIADQILFMKKG
jgi:hypothetical protein